MTGQMQATITRLRARDRGPLEELLLRDPITNVYLLSEIRERKMATDWWGILDSRGVRSAMLCGSLVVPYITDMSDATGLGRVLSEEHPRVRMMVGPQDSVSALHEAFGRPANEIKRPQLVMLLNRGQLRGSAQPTPLRSAVRADIAQLTEAAAAMHHEEMGIDPLSVDSEGWRVRMTQLVERRWSWVWTEGGSMVFKAELSAWTPQAAQIQGVYTHPGWRKRGIATAALLQLCAMLLQQTHACTLYVNHYNTAACGLYDQLGFVEVSRFATVIY
jgi:predicted GNAT family acetyltransferase